MRTLFLLLMSVHVSSTVKHTLEYFLTSSHGISDFPKFLALPMLDGVPFGYCDGKTKAHSKHDWVKKLIKDNPVQHQWYVMQCLEGQHFSRENIDMIMRRLNQTGGVHILQMTSGCEWDDETGETVGFSQFGYDGEDFLALDLHTLTWTAPTPKALMTKYRWDREKAWLQENEGFFTQMCPLWIKKYLQYRRNFMQPTGNTSVSLLQKSPSSPVTCFATGFYPNRAAVFWRKDEEELYEVVEHGEILPNHDETFQISVDLNISAVKPEDWGRYECVFQLYGVKEDIITKLDKAVIRSNYESSAGFPVAAVITVVTGLFLLSVCILGLFILKRRNNGFQPANKEMPEERAGVH